MVERVVRKKFPARGRLPFLLLQNSALFASWEITHNEHFSNSNRYCSTPFIVDRQPEISLIFAQLYFFL